ncbi:MAG TPA: DUF1631 family protein, partial [Burkholderiaceae bacterium]|nr:DUF1631 family protein [Burkholderiaceae bacterium]
MDTRSGSTGSSGSEQYALVTGRQFLQTSGKIFVKRADEHYRGMLDRAIETMHTDLRVSIHQLSAANLTLVDDDTVNSQIEVDRLVLRLRDAGEGPLRKLNVIVGQLHNDYEAKERENPFRPYLLARTVHQMLLEMVADEETRKPLFTLMSESLFNRVADFYGPILEVFETSGLYKELMAQKPRQVRKQRDFDGNTLSPGGVDFDARVLPGLQRMLSMMSHMQLPGGSGAPGVPGNPTNATSAAGAAG